MKEMLLNKYTIALILLILTISFIGGLDAKKTAEIERAGGQQINDLYK